MSVSTNDFKNGMTLDLDGVLFQVIEFQHVKPGKGGAFVRTKLRNVKTGAVIERTFNAGVKGDRVSGALKPVTLETGLVVNVPLFVEEGEKVKVDTRTGEYIERVK